MYIYTKYRNYKIKGDDSRARKSAPCLMQLDYFFFFFCFVFHPIYIIVSETHTYTLKKKMNDKVNRGHDKCKSFKRYPFFSTLYLSFFFFLLSVLVYLPPAPRSYIKKCVFVLVFTRQHHTHFRPLSRFFSFFSMIIKKQAKTKKKGKQKQS